VSLKQEKEQRIRVEDYAANTRLMVKISFVLIAVISAITLIGG